MYLYDVYLQFVKTIYLNNVQMYFAMYFYNLSLQCILFTMCRNIDTKLMICTASLNILIQKISKKRGGAGKKYSRVCVDA